jgi:ribonuclease HI
MGLLYKLAECGIKGKMLAWIKEYITERTFTVYYEGEYSSKKTTTSGLPQGSSLSPMLFNVMMRDIPTHSGVKYTAYADDISIFAEGDNQKDVLNIIQTNINEITRWADKWGMEFNVNKTKAMIFSRKKNIKKCNIKLKCMDIEIVNQHRYLGMILDAPYLTWKQHIKQLKTKVLSKMNILSSVSHQHWGADRVMLLRLYKSLVRSVMDYGCIFYDSSSKTNLKSLDPVQNRCLRIAIGARKTTPVLSLEVEADILPLDIHRKMVIMRYHARVSELPHWVPAKMNLFYENKVLTKKKWSIINVPPLSVRVQYAYQEIETSPSKDLASDLISPFPPWLDLTKFVEDDFMSSTVKETSEMEVNQIFKSNMENKYQQYLEIYTDGSKHTTENTTSAGMIIGKLDVMEKWLLSPYITVLGAELFAIDRALRWVLENADKIITNKGIVILTDSLSAIQLIQDRLPKTYRYRIFGIQNSILHIMTKMKICIQWIPSHKNIIGNEIVDKIAKDAQNNKFSTLSRIAKEEKVREIRIMTRNMWQRVWRNSVLYHNKGKFLTNIKECVAYWPWASNKIRVIETVMSRLRLGHAGVKQHLLRFNISNDDKCECREVETITHFLLECPIYSIIRRNMKTDLTKLGVTINLKNILGGGNYSCSIQQEIIEIIGNYLFQTGRIYEI